MFNRIDHIARRLMRQTVSDKKSGRYYLPQPLAILTLLLCLYAADLSAWEPPQTINVFTVDNEMNGYGDLVSNWYAAQMLKNLYPWLQVNIYISSYFHKKFARIEPRFNRRSRWRPKPIVIDGITVYWHSQASEAKRNADIDAMLAADDQSRRICNLAFTVSADDLMREAPTRRGSVPKKSWARYVSERAQSLPGKENAPFLGFDFLLEYTDSRFRVESQRYLSVTEGIRFPLYMFIGALEAGSLFISHRPPKFGLQSYDLNGWLGFAYANTPWIRADYIRRIAKLAHSDPSSDYIVVLGSAYDVRQMDGLYLQKTQYSDHQHLLQVDGNDSGVMQGVREDREFYRLKIHQNGKAVAPENLYIVRYAKGLPLQTTQTVIRSANLPILVSGTMSLSFAVQYDKPFIYEVMQHHFRFARAIHERFAERGHAGILNGMLYPYEPEILRYEQRKGDIRTVIYTNENDKNPSLLFSDNVDERRDRYQRYQDDLYTYRTSLRGWPMLDVILSYCHAARRHFEYFRAIPVATEHEESIKRYIGRFNRDYIGSPTYVYIP